MYKLLCRLMLACVALVTFSGCPVSGSSDANEGRWDRDGDGYAEIDDCDDRDRDIHPDALERCDGIDSNCDNASDEADVDGDRYFACEDCDDRDADVNPGATELCNSKDDDCDGQMLAAEVDGDGDGSLRCNDCDDADSANFPGNLEACDGLDNDCDGFVPTVEDDADADGYRLCEEDCNDADTSVHPGATEVCDGLDNDCNNQLMLTELDEDGDGMLACNGEDCDDSDASVFRGATEQCNGVDDDCDSNVDEGVAIVNFLDADGDGFGSDSAVQLVGCQEIPGYVLDGGDCNDLNATVHPGADEGCDSVDTDCDGALGAAELDADGDGLATCDGDCLDTDATVFPGAEELCDGLDTDCDPLTGEFDLCFDGLDQDSDGMTVADGDCDDFDASIYTGAPEICDGLDNDCDGLLMYAEEDFDGDGAGLCDGDCNDFNPMIGPNATEIPYNGIDEDCQDGDLADMDGDGFNGGFNGTDCDDLDATVNPSEAEACGDGVDNNCNGDVDENLIVQFWDSDGDGFGNPLSEFSLCVPVPGFVLQGDDCEDNNSTVFPGAVELCDGVSNDCDSLALPANEADLDGDLQRVCDGDCNDNESQVYLGATESCDGLDNDCNLSVDEGFADVNGNGITDCMEVDVDGDGFTPADGDCNDTNPAINPDAVEVCDFVDNNCNGVRDEEVTFVFFFDGDGDGYGAPVSAVTMCTAPANFVLLGDDCADNDANVFPGANEVCNGLDDDCQNGPLPLEVDQDGDLQMVCEGDCDDLDALASAGAEEVCDGVDNDCDGVTDEGFADENGNGIIDCVEVDVDGDGFTPADGDCNDSNAGIGPSAVEVCDEIDNNCNGVIDEGVSLQIVPDADGDGFGNDLFPRAACFVEPGYVLVGGDCDDLDSATFPGATELCNGVDDSCDSVVPANELDADADGQAVCAGDCNDSNPLVYSGNLESCDGLDNDCNGQVDEAYPDSNGDGQADCVEADYDGDGVTPSAGDCNDTDSSVNPNATEVCDGIDNNCSGQVDEGTLLNTFLDADGDGFGNDNMPLQTCTVFPGYVLVGGDCDDLSAQTHPGAVEVCDGVDNDCVGGLPSMESDVDLDGFSVCEGDCDDLNNTLTPADLDGDGYSTCNGDCNDGNSSIALGEPEVCDSLDNDCNGVVDDGGVCDVTPPSCGGLDDPWTVDVQEDCNPSGSQFYSNSYGQNFVILDGAVNLVQGGDFSGGLPAGVVMNSISPTTFVSTGYDPATGYWEVGHSSLITPGPGSNLPSDQECLEISLTGLSVGSRYAVSGVYNNEMPMAELSLTYYLDAKTPSSIFAELEAPRNSTSHAISMFQASATAHTVHVCSGGNYLPFGSGFGDVSQTLLAVTLAFLPGPSP